MATDNLHCIDVSNALIVIGSRDFGSEKVVAPETVSSYQSPSGGVPSASPFSDQQEKQLRSEIDRLNAELARVSKKAEYWEQESQNSSRKIDQNAVYYNDRINTLDSELLDGRRQLVAKEDELFSIRNSLRNAESDLLRTKDLLQAAQTDASRRQQLHTDQLAVEQRKLTALETQLKEVQMTVYAKDDEIRQLKAAANDAGATSRSSPVASSESDVAVELRAKVQSLQATIDRLESANQLQFDELRDAKRKLDAKDGDMGSLTAEVERLKQQLRLASESSSSTSQETNRQVEFLQNELTQAKDANASLSLALKQKEDEFRKFQQQREQSIGEMRDKLEDAEKSKLFLTHSITEKDQELAVLRRKADLLEQSQTANQDVARTQERELRLIGQHEQEIANMRGKIDDLKHELSLLQINSSSTAASLQAKNEEIESLRTLQAKLHENIKILEKEKHDKDVAHLQLHTQLDAKNIEIARLQNASGQLEYFREVSRVREEEIAQLKLQLMTSVQQAQAAAVKSNEAMLSPTELSELQMENSLLKTKLDTKQVELRSRTEEVHFLQEKLDAAFKDLSAAQNQARSAQSEAKTLKSEVESLQHHLQIETESTAAKDKKIRGFREELLHLQKLLSEAEQAKRRERDTSDAHTQTKAEAPKEVAHVGVQKSVVAYDVGVSATQRVEQRDVGAQASLATAAPPAAPPAVATRVFSVQTDPVQPEVREIVRTVPVPMATAAEPQLEAVITSEMRLQMDYMREVKEELSQKMQQCNLLLSTLAARDAASANRAAATAATTATATAARSGRAVQMNNFLRDTSDDASGDSPPADAATRRASHVQIVRDENVTPNDKARHRRATDRRVDETDDLDSVSDIRSPDDGATFSLVDRLSALFTAVLQGSVGYKASTSGDTRVLHAILGGQQDATAARHAMARLAENKHRALCSLTRDFAAHLTACKDIIRHGRSVVADMKRQYARRANSKDEINELTFDLNLAIRLARKLQETLELVKAQNKELAVDTAQLKGKSRASAGNAVVAMAQLIVGVDRAVESFSSLATTLVNQMSRAATTDSVPSPVGYADRRTLVDDTDDASDFDYELIAQTRPTPALRGRDLYPARSASPPTTRSHRHTTVSGATATLRASSAHGHGGRAASLSPSRRPAKSADYRDKLDIIQHQLNSAQQKHVDSLREYDRHYKCVAARDPYPHRLCRLSICVCCVGGSAVWSKKSVNRRRRRRCIARPMASAKPSTRRVCARRCR